MPSSDPQLLTPVVQQIQQLKPKRVLDVGIGFGKWGALCREYLDVWNLRVKQHEWTTEIVGVEPCSHYLTYATTIYYSRIYAQTFQEAMPALQALGQFDLAICTDVIEHMEKSQGIAALFQLGSLAKVSLVSVPLGAAWLRANRAWLELNPLEEHRASWEASELIEAGYKQVAIVGAARGPIGLFRKDTP